MNGIPMISIATFFCVTVIGGQGACMQYTCFSIMLVVMSVTIAFLMFTSRRPPCFTSLIESSATPPILLIGLEGGVAILVGISGLTCPDVVTPVAVFDIAGFPVGFGVCADANPIVVTTRSAPAVAVVMSNRDRVCISYISDERVFCFSGLIILLIQVYQVGVCVSLMRCFFAQYPYNKNHSRACSLVVEHGIRIAETRVRFSPGPPLICTAWFARALVGHLWYTICIVSIVFY